ncbi:MAG: hypothetical protein ACJ8F7_19250 [Gemmataceae bacterium]
MKRIPRIALLASSLFAVVAGAAYAAPEWSQRVGADFWNVPRLMSQTANLDQQGEQLNSQCAGAEWRAELKTGMATDLLAGRVTLAEASARCRELNAGTPYFLPECRRLYPTASDDELYCRNVMDTLRNQFPGESPVRSCLTRCEAELERLRVAGGGEVRLP